RDITDRKRAERETAASESRLRVALGNIDMAVFTQDRDLRYTWVFQPHLVPPEGVVGRTDLDMLEQLRLPAIEKVIAAKRRDLHDELGQLLTALKMGLRSLEATVGSIDPENVNGVLDRVVAASETVDQTLTTIRRIATELRPGSLDRLGLVPALRQEIRRFE